VHEADISSIVNDDGGRGAELEHRALALRGKLAELRVRQDQTFELMQKTRAVDRGFHPACGAGAAGPNSLMNLLVCTKALPY